MKLLRIESELESVSEECLMVVPDEYNLETVYDAVLQVLPEPTVVEVVKLPIEGRFHLYRPYFG